jgi:hypothetical protein
VDRGRGIRKLIVVGLLLVAGVALAAVGTTRPFSDSATFVRHHGGVHRHHHPHPTASPSPTPDGHHEHGSTDGTGSSSDGQTITEHHDIHTSGSVTVVSGNVDEGTGGGETHGVVVGHPRPAPPRRSR